MKTNLVSKIKKAYWGVSATALLASAPSVAFADDGDTDNRIGAVIGKIVEIILTFFKYVGIVILVYGIGAFVLALRNEDMDSKSKSIYMLIIGAILTTLGFLAKPIVALISPDIANSIN